MADLRGVGTPITYSDDNPVSDWIDGLRKKLTTQRSLSKEGRSLWQIFAV